LYIVVFLNLAVHSWNTKTYVELPDKRKENFLAVDLKVVTQAGPFGQDM
jgi:hypothetical protein